LGHPGKNWGKINVPTVTKMGTGRMNIPNKPGTPKRPLRLEAEAKWSYQPTRREARPWEENIVELTALEGYEEE
jgi:hypothetical protein